MRDATATRAARAELDEAIRRYHATLDDDDCPAGSVPMSWIVVYSASAIDADGDVVWGNHAAMSNGDPNAHSGLASWALDTCGASTEDYGD